MSVLLELEQRVMALLYEVFFTWDFGFLFWELLGISILDVLMVVMFVSTLLRLYDFFLESGGILLRSVLSGVVNQLLYLARQVIWGIVMWIFKKVQQFIGSESVRKAKAGLLDKLQELRYRHLYNS
ncbi:MAG: hypothetical protein AAFO69_07175 [Bacteroidota bacterium]